MAENKIGSMRHSINLVRHLRASLLRMRNAELNRLPEPYGDGKWRPLPDTIPCGDRPLLSSISEMVKMLDQELNAARYGTRSSEYQLPDGEFWTLGSTTLTFPIRSIWGGFVEPVRRVPVVQRVPEIVVNCLLDIPGERDLLQREHHNQVGWHYHYLDYKKARSNLVLCWDTRTFYQKGKERPLFQEKHGEGHADFVARPELWGLNKRQSMHEACSPDLDKWQLNTFRCASKKARPVWPLSSTLTPIAENAPPLPRFPSKEGRNRRRR